MARFCICCAIMDGYCIGGERGIMRELQIHRVYKHFKGDCYLVEDVARHSETDEEMVVYRKLYDDGSLWVRPKDMFLAEVDREKYPDATQKFRFELQDIPSTVHPDD